MTATGTFSSKRDPLARPENTYLSGSARFQFLSERMLRIEWAEDGVFEDRPSLSVVNRNLDRVEVSVTGTFDTTDSGEILLSTACLSVRYLPDGKPFHPGNLSIRVHPGSGCPEEVIWHPGIADPENLKGTIRTLDRMNGAVFHVKEPNPNPASAEKIIRTARSVDLGPGLVSKSGWALYDDSASACVEFAAEGHSRPAARRGGNRSDWYFFGYGRDYKAALREAQHVFGAQPLPPRYVFGYWWSRFWAYTDSEFEDLVLSFRRADVPLSVLVVDMDWHLEGWTGYTWDRRFFPDPDGFLSGMKAGGLRISLNIHPHEGIGSHEEAFEAAARLLGCSSGGTDRIPFDVTDPLFMETYFELLHHPLERKGVDFWWLDWQQGETSSVKGLDPLPWLNHLYWTDAERNRGSRRPLVFSRYGGLGSGRYPIGFSGDTYQSWESLSFQPYFTATSANVLYGYWSHDIGGHFAEKPDPELYTRWLQWGMYSPVLRTHAERSPAAERRVWEYPEPFGPVMRQTIRDRHQLIPYIYSEAEKAAETGLSLCRPLYYEYPDREEAYRNGGEYFFGDSLLVSPVTTPASPWSGTSEKAVWLPEGRWIDTATGSVLDGGKTHSERYLLDEVPAFVKPGTIIPKLPRDGGSSFCAGTAASYPSLSISLYTGADGEYTLYEDDGESVPGPDTGSVRIGMSWVENEREGVFSIAPPEGSYEGFLQEKHLELNLHLAHPPLAVEIRGTAVPFRTPGAEPPCWSYVGDTRTTTVVAGKADLSEGLRLIVVKARSFESCSADGLPGVMRRLKHLMSSVRLLFSLRDCHPGERMIVGMAQTGRRLSLKPQTYTEELERLKEDLAAYPDVLRELRDRYSPDDTRHAVAEKALNLMSASEDLFARFIRRS